jgi:hypothetical protein
LLSLESHEEFQVPKAEAETFRELGEKRAIRRSGTPNVTPDEDDFRPGAPFFTKLAAV